MTTRIFLVLLGVLVADAQPANVQQRTTGTCSPAVADTKGNVTITCYGVHKELAEQIAQLVVASKRSGNTLRDISNKLTAVLAELRIPSTASVNQEGAITPTSVLSVGQQGGVTAGQVNINTPPQVLASQQVQGGTGNPQAPWVTRFSIRSTGLVAIGDLRLKCTGPVVRAGIGRINPASFISGSNGPDPKDPTVVVYELGAEMLSAGREIPMEVYSKEAVTVISGTIGAEVIHFP